MSKEKNGVGRKRVIPILIGIPLELLEEVDALVLQQSYTSRSELVREALRVFLEARKE